MSKRTRKARPPPPFGCGSVATHQVIARCAERGRGRGEFSFLEGSDSHIGGREEVQNFNPETPNSITIELQEICPGLRWLVSGGWGVEPCIAEERGMGARLRGG